MKKFGPFEQVYVESDWYDGPRGGIADIDGVPHRFKSLFDEGEDEYLGSFVIWPINKPDLALELEQWQIFARWFALYESGKADLDSHPATGGIDARWDELEIQLSRSRSEIPVAAKRALAEFERLDRDIRYEAHGPDYKVRWCYI